MSNKIKYLEDYLDEMSELFPQIEKKEMKRILNDMSIILSRYMRRTIRGFTSTSQDTLMKDNKTARFLITRVVNVKTLNTLRKRMKAYKKKVNGKT